jgi:hypothetical protein
MDQGRFSAAEGAHNAQPDTVASFQKIVKFLLAVFRDILVRIRMRIQIRILGSIPLTTGSGC